MTTETNPVAVDTRGWPEGLTRVPYWAFQREDVYRDEQQRIFQGNVWNYLGFEVDVPNPGDYRMTFVGDASVVVTRNAEGEICAFENRCAHRGALICLDERGGGKKALSCVYHGWTYDLRGNLVGVAFKDGLKGKGGMPRTFCMEEHSPRKLRTAVVHGLVFGSFSDDVLPIEHYLGEKIMARIERVLGGRGAALPDFLIRRTIPALALRGDQSLWRDAPARNSRRWSAFHSSKMCLLTGPS